MIIIGGIDEMNNVLVSKNKRYKAVQRNKRVTVTIYDNSDNYICEFKHKNFTQYDLEMFVIGYENGLNMGIAKMGSAINNVMIDNGYIADNEGG